MLKKLFSVALGVGLCASSFGAFSEGLTVDKLNSLNKLRNVIVSPDGSRLVFGMKSPEANGDKANNNLYVLSLEGKNAKPQQLTSHPTGEYAAQWNIAGDGVYFLSSRSGTSQVWYISLRGGEARQVTDLPLDIEDFKISPNNQKLVLAVSVLPSCEDFACTVKDKASQKDKKSTGFSYDKLMVRHWDKWVSRYKTHLFVGQINTKGRVTEKVRDLIPGWDTDVPAKPFSGMEEVAFTADSSKVVFSAKQPGRDHAWTTNFDLFEVSVDGGDIVNLTESNKAWDSHPVFSKDGRFMAYMAHKRPGFESDRFALMLKDLRSGAVKEVAPLWDRSVRSLSFSDDNRAIFVTAQDVGQVSIFEISTNFGDVKKIYGEGYAGDVQIRGAQVYFTRHSLDKPKDIYVVGRDGFGVRQLTDVNKDKLAGVKMAEFDQFDFKGWNDETVHGYWLKPTNFEQGKKYPLAFLVHGGPQGSFGNMFHFRWNAQLWANQGFGVVMIDFHGSTGYGQDFTDSITKDWGGKPLEDLQKGLKHITQTQLWLDRDKACALGASYGGYMMNWIQGNWTDGFNCLINHAGLFDTRSFYSVTEELWFPEFEMGGPMWSQSADYSAYNPAKFVTNWQTPMLVIHGLKDYRVPYGQGLGAFTALQRNNIPSKLLIFPDENHWILNQDNLKQWYDEVFEWMHKYTQ